MRTIPRIVGHHLSPGDYQDYDDTSSTGGEELDVLALRHLYRAHPGAFIALVAPPGTPSLFDTAASSSCSPSATATPRPSPSASAVGADLGWPDVGDGEEGTLLGSATVVAFFASEDIQRRSCQINLAGGGAERHSPRPSPWSNSRAPVDSLASSSTTGRSATGTGALAVFSAARRAVNILTAHPWLASIRSGDGTTFSNGSSSGVSDSAACFGSPQGIALFLLSLTSAAGSPPSLATRLDSSSPVAASEYIFTCQRGAYTKLLTQFCWATGHQWARHSQRHASSGWSGLSATALVRRSPQSLPLPPPPPPPPPATSTPQTQTANQDATDQIRATAALSSSPPVRFKALLHLQVLCTSAAADSTSHTGASPPRLLLTELRNCDSGCEQLRFSNRSSEDGLRRFTEAANASRAMELDESEVYVHMAGGGISGGGAHSCCSVKGAGFLSDAVDAALARLDTLPSGAARVAAVRPSDSHHHAELVVVEEELLSLCRASERVLERCRREQHRRQMRACGSSGGTPPGPSLSYPPASPPVEQVVFLLCAAEVAALRAVGLLPFLRGNPSLYGVGVSFYVLGFDGVLTSDDGYMAEIARLTGGAVLTAHGTTLSFSSLVGPWLEEMVRPPARDDAVPAAASGSLPPRPLIAGHLHSEGPTGPATPTTDSCAPAHPQEDLSPLKRPSTRPGTAAGSANNSRHSPHHLNRAASRSSNERSRSSTELPLLRSVPHHSHMRNPGEEVAMTSFLEEVEEDGDPSDGGGDHPHIQGHDSIRTGPSPPSQHHAFSSQPPQRMAVSALSACTPVDQSLDAFTCSCSALLGAVDGSAALVVSWTGATAAKLLVRPSGHGRPGCVLLAEASPFRIVGLSGAVGYTVMAAAVGEEGSGSGGGSGGARVGGPPVVMHVAPLQQQQRSVPPTPVIAPSVGIVQPVLDTSAISEVRPVSDSDGGGCQRCDVGTSPLHPPSLTTDEEAELRSETVEDAAVVAHRPTPVLSPPRPPLPPQPSREELLPQRHRSQHHKQHHEQHSQQQQSAPATIAVHILAATARSVTLGWTLGHQSPPGAAHPAPSAALCEVAVIRAAPVASVPNSAKAIRADPLSSLSIGWGSDAAAAAPLADSTFAAGRRAALIDSLTRFHLDRTMRSLADPTAVTARYGEAAPRAHARALAEASLVAFFIVPASSPPRIEVAGLDPRHPYTVNVQWHQSATESAAASSPTSEIVLVTPVDARESKAAAAALASSVSVDAKSGLVSARLPSPSLSLLPHGTATFDVYTSRDFAHASARVAVTVQSVLMLVAPSGAVLLEWGPYRGAGASGAEIGFHVPPGGTQPWPHLVLSTIADLTPATIKGPGPSHELPYPVPSPRLAISRPPVPPPRTRIDIIGSPRITRSGPCGCTLQWRGSGATYRVSWVSVSFARTTHNSVQPLPPTRAYGSLSPPPPVQSVSEVRHVRVHTGQPPGTAAFASVDLVVAEGHSNNGTDGPDTAAVTVLSALVESGCGSPSNRLLIACVLPPVGPADRGAAVHVLRRSAERVTVMVPAGFTVWTAAADAKTQQQQPPAVQLSWTLELTAAPVEEEGKETARRKSARRHLRGPRIVPWRPSSTSSEPSGSDRMWDVFLPAGNSSHDGSSSSNGGAYTLTATAAVLNQRDPLWMDVAGLLLLSNDGSKAVPDRDGDGGTPPPRLRWLKTEATAAEAVGLPLCTSLGELTVSFLCDGTPSPQHCPSPPPRPLNTADSGLPTETLTLQPTLAGSCLEFDPLRTATCSFTVGWTSTDAHFSVDVVEHNGGRDDEDSAADLEDADTRRVTRAASVDRIDRLREAAGGVAVEDSVNTDRGEEGEEDAAAARERVYRVHCLYAARRREMGRAGSGCGRSTVGSSSPLWPASPRFPCSSGGGSPMAAPPTAPAACRRLSYVAVASSVSPSAPPQERRFVATVARLLPGTLYRLRVRAQQGGDTALRAQFLTPPSCRSQRVHVRRTVDQVVTVASTYTPPPFHQPSTPLLLLLLPGVTLQSKATIAVHMCGRAGTVAAFVEHEVRPSAVNAEGKAKGTVRFSFSVPAICADASEARVKAPRKPPTGVSIVARQSLTLACTDGDEAAWFLCAPLWGPLLVFTAPDPTKPAVPFHPHHHHHRQLKSATTTERLPLILSAERLCCSVPLLAVIDAVTVESRTSRVLALTWRWRRNNSSSSDGGVGKCVRFRVTAVPANAQAASTTSHRDNGDRGVPPASRKPAMAEMLAHSGCRVAVSATLTVDPLDPRFRICAPRAVLTGLEPATLYVVTISEESTRDDNGNSRVDDATAPAMAGAGARSSLTGSRFSSKLREKFKIISIYSSSTTMTAIQVPVCDEAAEERWVTTDDEMEAGHLLGGGDASGKAHRLAHSLVVTGPSSSSPARKGTAKNKRSATNSSEVAAVSSDGDSLLVSGFDARVTALRRGVSSSSSSSTATPHVLLQYSILVVPATRAIYIPRSVYALLLVATSGSGSGSGESRGAQPGPRAWLSWLAGGVLTAAGAAAPSATQPSGGSSGGTTSSSEGRESALDQLASLLGSNPKPRLRQLPSPAANTQQQSGGTADTVAVGDHFRIPLPLGGVEESRDGEAARLTNQRVFVFRCAQVLQEPGSSAASSPALIGGALAVTPLRGVRIATASSRSLPCGGLGITIASPPVAACRRLRLAERTAQGFAIEWETVLGTVHSLLLEDDGCRFVIHLEVSKRSGGGGGWGGDGDRALDTPIIMDAAAGGTDGSAPTVLQRLPLYRENALVVGAGTVPQPPPPSALPSMQPPLHCRDQEPSCNSHHHQQHTFFVAPSELAAFAPAEARASPLTHIEDPGKASAFACRWSSSQSAAPIALDPLDWYRITVQVLPTAAAATSDEMPPPAAPPTGGGAAVALARPRGAAVMILPAVEVPRTVQRLMVTSASATTLGIRWAAPPLSVCAGGVNERHRDEDDDNDDTSASSLIDSNALTYHVQYRALRDEPGRPHPPPAALSYTLGGEMSVTGSAEPSVLLRDLRPGTAYSVTVVAENGLGESQRRTAPVITASTFDL